MSDPTTGDGDTEIDARETTDAETTDAETTDAETTDAETTDAETTDAETTDDDADSIVFATPSSVRLVYRVRLGPAWSLALQDAAAESNMIPANYLAHLVNIHLDTHHAETVAKYRKQYQKQLQQYKKQLRRNR